MAEELHLEISHYVAAQSHNDAEWLFWPEKLCGATNYIQLLESTEEANTLPSPQNTPPHPQPLTELGITNPWLLFINRFLSGIWTFLKEFFFWWLQVTVIITSTRKEAQFALCVVSHHPRTELWAAVAPPLGIIGWSNALIPLFEVGWAKQGGNGSFLQSFTVYWVKNIGKIYDLWPWASPVQRFCQNLSSL